MGNSLGGKKTTKVMKIDGETFKIKAPVRASEVLKNHPAGLVLLESEAVKHYGVRAKPLEANQELQPKRLYFLVELPKESSVAPRRVRSGVINMSARDRLESLALSRRSASDLTIMKQTKIISQPQPQSQPQSQLQPLRLKLRLPKAEVEKLIKESKDEVEAGERIMGLCIGNGDINKNKNIDEIIEENDEEVMMLDHHVRWKVARNRVGDNPKTRQQKRVSFMPISEARTPLAVAS
ncbi:hypothetical protein HN51_033384 [Arachis hypogaea]|uniref:uncharacterized protein At1g66480 n=1 Tax=Arachis hypogaea TaxID=3818 RepID=UPI000DEC2368|nr:uncharacterized protein At1g66480 [Arachis hypogaea]QHO17881.1 uncharacterized protein DS421_10g315830 [Arachis hypogaea]